MKVNRNDITDIALNSFIKGHLKPKTSFVTEVDKVGLKSIKGSLYSVNLCFITAWANNSARNSTHSLHDIRLHTKTNRNNLKGNFIC